MLYKRIWSKSEIDWLKSDPGKTAIRSDNKDVTVVAPQTDSYFNKLIKLIPTETIALYLYIEHILEPSLDFYIHLVTFLIILILTGYFTYKTTSVSGLPVKWSQIIISCIAFIVWTFSLGGPFEKFNLYDQYIAEVSLPLASVILPLFYNGK